MLLLFIELRSVYENRSFNDPTTPDVDEVILSDKVKAGGEALDAIIEWATAKKSKLEELKRKEGGDYGKS